MKTLKPFITVLLFFLTVAVLVSSDAVFSSPENWSEVARFAGPAVPQVQNTTPFTITHIEWRIRWSFTPDPELGSSSGFVVFTYRVGDPVNYVNWIIALGPSQTNGTSYVSNGTGVFYMSISSGATLNYSLIVEQDIDSIPEFPILPLLPALFTTAIFLVAVKLRWRRGLAHEYRLEKRLRQEKPL